MVSTQHRAAQEQVYSACVRTALDLAAVAARHLLTRAGKSMLQRAAAATDDESRNRQVESAQMLTRHQDTFRQAYPEALRREFDALQQDDSPKPPAVNFESLELMGEEQVDEAVELVRAQQAVLSEVEAELTQLNALVSAAKGRDIVSASANPFRPEAWVRALRTATLQCPVPPWVRVRWLHYLSETLGPELAAIYRQLCDQLRKHGVTAAAYGVNLAPAGSGRDAVAYVAPPAVPAPARPAVQPPVAAPPVLNLRDLRRLLIGTSNLNRGASAAGSRFMEARPTSLGGETVDAGLTVPYAFEALQEMKQLDQIMQRMHQRRSSGALLSGDHHPGDQTAEPADTPAQALSEEVVKLMVDNVASDPRLLPQVQQAVRDLQPALLRLARNDPRFFRDKHHPTRQFLTEITERSRAWQSADMSGFAGFLEPMRQAVDALAAMPMESAEPFEFALQTLQDAWSEHEERSRRARATAARALMKAEQRNLIAQRIADSLRDRTDVMAASGEIRRFITGPWSQVMAAAEMADTGVSADPGGYSAIINDLIWSTQPRLAAENRIRLAHLVPPMLATLRRGLATIEYPQDKTQVFLQHLGDVHQMALRPQGDVVSGPAPVAQEDLDTELDQERRNQEIWVGPTEARDSGLVELSAMSPQRRVAPQPDEPATATASFAVERLETGMWAELYIDGAWSRWRLAWASPHSLLFMFTDGAGKYKSMTRSVLDTMSRLGALRILSEQSVLAGALDAVAERALRNSMAAMF